VEVPPALAGLLERASSEPLAARGEALEFLAEARAGQDLAGQDPVGHDLAGQDLAGGDPATASVALRVLGLVAREVGEVAEALAHLRQAVACAQEAGHDVLAAQARMTLALTLLYAGQTALALQEADRAAPVLRGADAARLRAQRALILDRLGRRAEALDEYRRALTALRRAGDSFWEARALNNRGMLQIFRGDLVAAEADLARAAELFAALGQPLECAKSRHNLGLVAARRGDVPTALARYADADDELRALGHGNAVGLLDHCEALLSVGISAEARDLAGRAVRELERDGLDADLAEALLLLAEAALLDGDWEAARSSAERAARTFARQGRPTWVIPARYLALRAAWASGERSALLLRRLLRTADALGEAGWPSREQHARLLAARVGLELGRLPMARAQLERASAARTAGPVDVRAQAWHATALLRLADGDRRGAGAALRAGLRVVDDHRGTLGASELRATDAAHASELAVTGVRMALQRGRGEQVLGWAERWRAGALLLPCVRPPDDPAMAADMVELRGLVAALAERGDAEDPAPLLRRQVALEAAIRRRTRRVHGTGPSELRVPPGPAELAPALADRALVEFVEVDGCLSAVVVADGRAQLRELGAGAAVAAENDSLRFALRRLAGRHAGPASHAAAQRTLTHAAARLDELLLGPVRALIGDRGLVLVPTGALHALPWSALPSLAGRAVSVAPSAALWLRASGQPAAAGVVVLVAGPGLAHAADEVALLGREWPAARRLTGARATVADVAGALDGAGTAHLATHCTLRTDNPLFSSLRLSDGPLTAYDLQRLEHAPGVLLLASCSSGLSVVHPGDELLGFAAVLLNLGATAVVASVVEVPDRDTQPLMARVHRGLRAGLGPAAALAGARADARADAPDDPAALAVAASFTCFGAG